MNLFFFNWPSHVGGADTKLAHLLPLLAPHYSITLVPNERSQWEQPEWRDWVERHGFQVALEDDLPARLEGWAVSLCNGTFVEQARYLKARERGLKIVWSNEMMWHFKAELGAVFFGRIDVVLFTSAAQRAVLEPGYRQALRNTESVDVSRGDQWGEIASPDGRRRLRWVETGNYIDPARFPFRERAPKRPGEPFVIGRVSRPDPDKFPDDFPASYERLGLREPVRFRVLGWSDQMAARWPEHVYDARWELLPTGSTPAPAFLDTLDVFAYDVSPRFRESWGRAVVEAMLCGVVPLVPRGGGHHLERLVPHGTGGFLCDGPEDFGRYARQLQDDPDLLLRLSRGARAWAVEKLCRAEEHLALWHRVFRE